MKATARTIAIETFTKENMQSHKGHHEVSHQAQQGNTIKRELTEQSNEITMQHSKQEQHNWIGRVMKMLGVRHEQTNLEMIQHMESKLRLRI